MTKSAAHKSLIDFINTAAASCNVFDSKDHARYKSTVAQKAAVMIVSRQMTLKQVRNVILNESAIGRHEIVQNIEFLIAE
jgi:hypothetical protein